jgi:hypothetical protein
MTMPDENVRKRILGNAYPGFDLGNPGKKYVELSASGIDVLRVSILDNNQCHAWADLSKADVKKLIVQLLEEI